MAVAVGIVPEPAPPGEEEEELPVSVVSVVSVEEETGGRASTGKFHSSSKGCRDMCSTRSSIVRSCRCSTCSMTSSRIQFRGVNYRQVGLGQLGSILGLDVGLNVGLVEGRGRT